MSLIAIVAALGLGISAGVAVGALAALVTLTLEARRKAR